MTYDLWDVVSGNAVAYYHSEAEMAALVRTLVDQYGSAYADDLDLTIEEDDDNVIQSLSGSELIAWVDEITGRMPNAPKAAILTESVDQARPATHRQTS